MDATPVNALDYQSVYLMSAPLPGQNGDAYSAFLNNVMTNAGYGLQAGQRYGNSPQWTTISVYTDSSFNLFPQTFYNCPYYWGDSYRFTIEKLSGTTWAMCAQDYWSHQAFDWYPETRAVGTYLANTPNCSVWFENWNTLSTWNQGWANNLIQANDAQEGSNGSYRYWSNDSHNGPGFSGSLSNGMWGQWYIPDIPHR